jgi:hypothetical protein
MKGEKLDDERHFLHQVDQGGGKPGPYPVRYGHFVAG